MVLMASKFQVVVANHDTISRTKSCSFLPVSAMVEPEPEQGASVLSCTTFNVLAPIYKRLDQQV